MHICMATGRSGFRGGVQLHSKTSGVEILPVLNPGSERERPSGGEETRPVTATRYKYDITGRGGGVSVKQLQVSDGNFALLVAPLSHQPIRIHAGDAADCDHL